MKRLLSMALALTIAGTSAAGAKGFGRGPYGPPGPGFGGYGQPYRGNNGNNAAMALGFGMLALGVIGVLASQNRGYAQPYYPVPAVPPPLPPAPYGYGYNVPPPAPPVPYGAPGNYGYGAPYGGYYGNGSDPYYYGR